MTTISLGTHCHSRDLPRLHNSGVLEELINCHQVSFSEIFVVHQRCDDLPYTLPNDNRIKVIDIREEDYPNILKKFGMNYDDRALAEITHDWGWQWFWQHHCVNHLSEILAANSEFIVFNDADCRIINQNSSWVEKGIDILTKHFEVFVVAPSDGGHEANSYIEDGIRLTQTMSQQLFMARTSVMKSLDFTNLQWDGKFDAPYGPMAEFYGMFEGWLWRYMRKNNLYRAILPEQWRYWHMAWH